MKRILALASALVFALAAASSALALREGATVSTQAIDPPLALGEGARGTIDLGTSLTAADVTYSALGLTRGNITQVTGSDQDWTIRMALDASSGIGFLDSYRIAFCNSSTCTDQIIVSTGTLTQTTGAPFTVPAGSSDIYVGVTDTKASLGNTVFDTTLFLLPPGATTPDLRYDYTVTVTT